MQFPQSEQQLPHMPHLGQQLMHLAHSVQQSEQDPHAVQQFWQIWDQQPEQQPLLEVGGSAPNEVLPVELL